MSDMLEARMRDVEDTLARIETKLDIALGDVNDHEDRLRSLECKSGKKWDGLIAQVVALIVAAIFGVIAGRFFG